MSSRRDAVVEDVEWLLSWGCYPSEIAHRVGYANTKNLMRMLHRWGRHELANALFIRESTNNESQEDDWAFGL